MFRESSLNRKRILRTAPSPDGQGTAVLVEALLTDDEIESIDAILSALARRQHPLGEQICKARHYARNTLFVYINQGSFDDRLSHIEEFHRDRRGRSRSPRTIAHLTSASLETPEPAQEPTQGEKIAQTIACPAQDRHPQPKPWSMHEPAQTLSLQPCQLVSQMPCVIVQALKMFHQAVKSVTAKTKYAVPGRQLSAEKLPPLRQHFAECSKQ